jgi:hypothetical protein
MSNTEREPKVYVFEGRNQDGRQELTILVNGEHFSEPQIKKIEQYFNSSQPAVKEGIEYQLCPKCNGVGDVYFPFRSTGTTLVSGGLGICDVCGGAKIIPKYYPAKEATQNIDKEKIIYVLRGLLAIHEKYSHQNWNEDHYADNAKKLIELLNENTIQEATQEEAIEFGLFIEKHCHEVYDDPADKYTWETDLPEYKADYSIPELYQIFKQSK